MEKEMTAMQIHIVDLQKIKQIVIDKKVDKELEETITETIDGCIENAESHLEREKNIMRKMYNRGGVWATRVSSEDYFNQNYSQE